MVIAASQFQFLVQFLLFPFQGYSIYSKLATESFSSDGKSNPELTTTTFRSNTKKKKYLYAELSRFDDLCSSLLLNSLYLGFETHKFMSIEYTLDEFVDKILTSSLNEL